MDENFWHRFSNLFKVLISSPVLFCIMPANEGITALWTSDSFTRGCLDVKITKIAKGMAAVEFPEVQLVLLIVIIPGRC